MSWHYILKDKNPVPVDDVLTWARWFEEASRSKERIVAQEKVTETVEVSTVFLGLDHNFLGKEPALLFETMVFGGDLDGEQDRYSTWEEAEAGHQEMLKRVKESLK